MSSNAKTVGLETKLLIDEQKQHIRAVAKEWRQQVGPEMAQEAAASVAATGLLALLDGEHEGKTIAGFASTPDELDTRPFLEALSIQNFSLALPVIVRKGAPLIFRQWKPGDDMGTGQWGIKEPLTHQPEIVPDIVLVPLLAFDKNGYRLGYGGGFYDRTLEEIRNAKPVLAIGLGYDDQEVDAVPHDNYDQRVNWVLTPTRVLKTME